MMGLSWPLWLDGGDFPRVPFLRSWPAGDRRSSGLLFAAIASTLAMASFGRSWRIWLSTGLVLIACSVVGDQSRLQPWISQFELLGLGLVLAPGRGGLALARFSTITLYAYSGASKLDAAFVGELGPAFLAAGLAPFGLTAEGWPDSSRSVAILAMPAWEVAVAVGLCFGRSRRLALLGAIAQHGALISILGPWGLGHSPNVLIWNAAMIAEDCLLFWPRPIPTGPGEPASTSRRIALATFAFAATWPAAERWGLCDSWPGHALYASHSERAEVFVPEEDADRLPATTGARLGPADLDGWRRLDLTGWSRDLRGVPVYPQARVGLGIAQALAAIPGGSRPVRVVLRGRAGLWDGRRERVECVGLPAMRRGESGYLINARPSGSPQTGPAGR